MRRAALLFSVVLSACVGQVSAPSPSPATVPPAAATPTPTASAPSASPTATPRVVKPFVRVVPVSLPDTGFAVDRERVAFLEGPVDARRVDVVDVATGQRSTAYTASSGWRVDLSPRGLRADTLVFTERRSEGDRTDGRVVRIDLRTRTTTTLDEWSGPFLGGGDVWNPEAAITNGTDALWIRITSERAPWAVDLLLASAGRHPQVLRTSASATWADLDDAGRVAVSTLISTAERAELELWTAGNFASLGARPSADGGPVRFVGDRILWAVGSGIVRRIDRVQLVAADRSITDVDTGSCDWLGVAGRYLTIGCGTGAARSQLLLDPATGTRGDAIATFNLVGAARAALWREGSQWWLGMLAP